MTDIKSSADIRQEYSNLSYDDQLYMNWIMDAIEAAKKVKLLNQLMRMTGYIPQGAELITETLKGEGA